MEAGSDPPAPDLESRDASRQIDAAQQLLEINDIAVIPVIETVFAKAGATAGAAAVKTIAAMPEIKASESLVRFAVLAENEEVRKSAAAAPQTRRLQLRADAAGRSEQPDRDQFSDVYGRRGHIRRAFEPLPRGPTGQHVVHLGRDCVPNFTPAVGGLTTPQTAQAEQRVAQQAAQDSVTAQAAMAENVRTAWANGASSRATHRHGQ